MKASKKIGTILLGALLVTGSLGFTSSSRAADMGGSISQLNVRLSQLNAQIVEHKKQMDLLKGQKASIESQIAAVEQQIQDTDQKIAIMNDKLNLLNKQISDVTAKITQTQKQLEHTDELLRKRLQVMYENGDVSYLDVLMNSTDFSDFVDRLNLLSLIVKQDKDLLVTVKKLKDQLQTEQDALKQQQTDQLNSKAELDQVLAEQQSQKQNKLVLENQINQNISATQSAISQETREQVSIDSALAAAIAAQLAAQQSNPFHGNPNSKWVWPVPSTHYITSGYGPRDGGFHKGIDIGAPTGTPIVAVADGRVLFSGSASGFGHWIVIEHGPNLMSVYGHMYASGLLVSVGQDVKAGQVIARVGSDGESTGPHLHFAVATGISGGSMLYVNPTGYLPMK